MISQQQKELCLSMVSLLLEERLVFPYYKNLARYISIPEDIMDKSMIQYCADRDSKIELEIRILPDEEEYHTERHYPHVSGRFCETEDTVWGEIMNTG